MFVLRNLVLAATFLLIASTASAHVALISPNGGEQLRGQQQFTIEWYDIVNHGSSVTYDLEFSNDRGTTWTPIVQNLPYTDGFDSYTWIVPDVDTLVGRIRVVMYLDPFTYWEDTSEGNFTIMASYSSYGSGSPLNGVEPSLELHNLPQAGGNIVVHVANAQVGANAHIIAGRMAQNSFLYGVTLLATTDITHRIIPVDNNGEVFVPNALPIGAVGVTVYIQAVIASAPTFSATAGVQFMILP
ncbi:MAG: hypothetical protein HQ519_11935 [Planctomycetes bacterium]|nr:hypothetical protein [Planctomycetota bacterium]